MDAGNHTPVNSGLVLWGGGGHGKVVADVALAMECFSPIGFVDDDDTKSPKALYSCRVEGTPGELVRLKERGYTFFLISIGSNEARARCFANATESGLVPATLVHPAAVISPMARVDKGTVVMAGVIVNPDAHIGQDCIINTAAVIEHDCEISDHVHISPGVVLAGGVAVGRLAHVGAGAIVLPGGQIGEGAVVGAGAVVLRSVPAWTTVAGVPARVIHAHSTS
jgi:sugar O-acyltransferase (sialic acid O-acetyltransferase NeuD family)